MVFLQANKLLITQNISNMKIVKQYFTAKRAIAVKTVLLVALMLFQISGYAQDNTSVNRRNQGENYGNTFNLGLGIGYYGYLDQDIPILFANYEFRIARHMTLAPFLGYSSYRSYDNYYYGNSYYYYQETIIPFGAKVAYYFDELLGAGPRWDFYLAASLGFVYDHVAWEDGYNGDMGVAHTASPLYLDGHIDARYHISKKFGLYLDLSTGVSTVGISLHSR